MSDEFIQIKKENILRAAEKCPTAKEVLREIAPEAFENEVEPVSGGIYESEFDYYRLITIDHTFGENYECILAQIGTHHSKFHSHHGKMSYADMKKHLKEYGFRFCPNATIEVKESK